MNTIRIGENCTAISVFGDRTSDCVAQIRKLFIAVEQSNLSGIRSVRCGLDVLLVEHEPEFDPAKLTALVDSGFASEISGEVIQIPVCYDEEFGRDLKEIAEQTGLKKSEIIELHISRSYQVWMIGFLPGFPYLGELPKPLQLERKRIPDPLVPAGSVAIAEEYTGIYPFDSPGGWHVLGRTPLSIIEYSKPDPWLFEYGMQIQFYPISASEFRSRKS